MSYLMYVRYLIIRDLRDSLSLRSVGMTLSGETLYYYIAKIYYDGEKHKLFFKIDYFMLPLFLTI